MEEDQAIPRIVEALRAKDGVIITFADGKSAVYSAALLYAMFPKTDESIEDLSARDD